MPIQEYVLVALPHLLFVVIVRRIPLITVGEIYLVFVSCVVLYHLIGSAADMVMRRWIRGYLLSVFLSGFLMLLMGYLWPAITGQSLPFALLGNQDLQDANDILSTALALIYSLVVWALGIVLLSIVIPSHHACLWGIRQAQKPGWSAPLVWEDDASSLTLLSLFVVASLASFWMLFSELSQAGLREAQIAVGVSCWHLPVVLGLVMVYTILLLQVREVRRTMLFICLQLGGLWWQRRKLQRGFRAPCMAGAGAPTVSRGGACPVPDAHLP